MYRMLRVFSFCTLYYAMRTIAKCADTGCVPPASSVIVSAAALAAGFRTVRMLSVCVVSMIDVPITCDVPVARPATV